MAKKKEKKQEAGAPSWMITYGDMMTLLLCSVAWRAISGCLGAVAAAGLAVCTAHAMIQIFAGPMELCWFRVNTAQVSKFVIDCLLPRQRLASLARRAAATSMIILKQLPRRRSHRISRSSIPAIVRPSGRQWQ